MDNGPNGSKEVLWLLRRTAEKLIRHEGRERYSKDWGRPMQSFPHYFTFTDQQAIHDQMAWSMFSMFWPQVGLFALVGTAEGAPWSPINERRDIEIIQK